MYGLLLTAFMIALHAVSFQTAISQNFNQFIPRGYELLDSQSGDINQDGYTDYVIICKNPNEMEDEESKRPLIILHGQDDGSLYEAVRNDNVALNYFAGGPVGDPYTGMTIKKNFFSIEHMCGGGSRFTRIITFKYNPVSLHYVLHKDAGVIWNTSNPNKSKSESFNKKQWGKMLFENYKVEQ
jgi:hypothetical protein